MENATRLRTSGDIVAVLLMTCGLLLLERNQRRRKRTERLLDAVNQAQYEIATASLDRDQVMDLIIRHTKTLVDSDGAVIEMIDGKDMVYLTASGAAAEYVGLRMGIEGSFSGLCIRMGGTLISTTPKSTSGSIARPVARSASAR